MEGGNKSKVKFANNNTNESSSVGDSDSQDMSSRPNMDSRPDIAGMPSDMYKGSGPPQPNGIPKLDLEHLNVAER